MKISRSESISSIRSCVYIKFATQKQDDHSADDIQPSPPHSMISSHSSYLPHYYDTLTITDYQYVIRSQFWLGADTNGSHFTHPLILDVHSLFNSHLLSIICMSLVNVTIIKSMYKNYRLLS